jgi:hypothetical protein
MREDRNKNLGTRRRSLFEDVRLRQQSQMHIAGEGAIERGSEGALIAAL